MSTIEDLSNRSAQINRKLRELLARHEYPDDNKTAWVRGSLDVALEHQEAILLLIKSELFGSAFAMERIVFDTVLRALWISGVTTPGQIEQAREDELDWRKICVRDQVEKICFGGATQAQTREFFQRLKEAWSAMCSYTHSGALQIARRFTNGDLKPNYDEGEILEALNLTNAPLLILSGKFFMSMGHRAAADETLRLLNEYRAAASPSPPELSS